MAYVHPLYLRSKPRMQFRHRHWREGDRERERERERDRVIGCGWWFCFNRAASSSSSSSSKSNQTTRGCSRNCSLRLKEARRLRRSAKAELVVTELNKCLVDWFKRPVSFFDAQNAEFELKGLAAGADSREMEQDAEYVKESLATLMRLRSALVHSIGRIDELANHEKTKLVSQKTINHTREVEARSKRNKAATAVKLEPENASASTSPCVAAPLTPSGPPPSYSSVPHSIPSSSSSSIGVKRPAPSKIDMDTYRKRVKAAMLSGASYSVVSPQSPTPTSTQNLTHPLPLRPSPSTISFPQAVALATQPVHSVPVKQEPTTSTPASKTKLMKYLPAKILQELPATTTTPQISNKVIQIPPLCLPTPPPLTSTLTPSTIHNTIKVEGDSTQLLVSVEDDGWEDVLQVPVVRSKPPIVKEEQREIRDSYREEDGCIVID